MRDDLWVELAPGELRIDVDRAGHRTAVRVTHVPSGKSVTVDDEPSNHLSRERALTLLGKRLGGDGGDTSGDREPRRPGPDDPTTAAELNLPKPGGGG
ncbi:MAG TPA: hypothetical protein VNG13_01575 [Mycobacteriales bacterium]|nr:hypothetical protein [Mycobacteriales bacterium]